MAGWIMLFIGTVLSAVGPDYFWVAPLFATLFGLGLGGGLLPEGATRQVLMLVWRSYFHFIFALIFVYLALLPLTPHPGPLAATVAGVFTLLVALSLYADSQKGPVAKRWSHRLTGLTLLIVLPVGLWLLVLAVVGGSLAQGAAGGGAIGGVLWWALKNGFLAAASVGLGGRFGGGGASGGE